MTKAIAYFRVSTKDQGSSGLGIEAQQEAVARWLPPGMALFDSFTETESGRRADRPKLKAAIDACLLYGATLVVAKLDRLTRNSAFLEMLLERVEKEGLQIAFCDVPAVSGPSGTFILRALVAVAQLEAEMTSARTKAALAAKKARGYVFKGRPGHTPPPQLQEAAARGRIAKANARAELYRGVLTEIGPGTYAKIADALNDRGVPTPGGGQEWTPTAVWRLMRRLGA